MRQTLTSPRGMVTAPHHLAASSACAVLREGGNAIEAMVSAAATIAVVYPHMNSIGGDGFWIISEPGQAPLSIDACGAGVVERTPPPSRSTMPGTSDSASCCAEASASGSMQPSPSPVQTASIQGAARISIEAVGSRTA